MRAAILLLAALGAIMPATARAQTAPPPAEIPRLPDVPLPVWQAPPPSASRPLLLGVARELRSSERLRYSGLVTASFGLAALLSGGIVEAWAVGLDTELHSPRDGRFHPEIDEQRHVASAAALSLLTVGSVLTVSGFTLYAVGQTRINRWHKRHPRDELPPQSGF
jgi:hypothetical protein